MPTDRPASPELTPERIAVAEAWLERIRAMPGTWGPEAFATVHAALVHASRSFARPTASPAASPVGEPREDRDCLVKMFSFIRLDWTTPDLLADAVLSAGFRRATPGATAPSDTQRLDWLEKHPAGKVLPGFEAARHLLDTRATLCFPGPTPGRMRWSYMGAIMSLREAIDAAMASTPPSHEEPKA